MQQNQGAALDQPDLAVLYQRFAPVLFAHLQRHTAAREDAEDLLLEVFVAALEYPRFATLSAKEQEGWLWSVMRNKTIDLYRRNTRRPGLRLDNVADSLYERDEYAPEQVMLRREELALLQRHIADLPELQREILRLRFANDLRCGEIATLLQKSEGAIRMLLSRTMKLLREMYKTEKGGRDNARA
jgi:RNA polymerase sigma-70 factor (ECF subfamily)